MKHIEISDAAYQALSARHGDVAAFVEQLAHTPVQEQAASESSESFFDALDSEGLIGCIKNAPGDLSSNSDYLEDLGT